MKISVVMATYKRPQLLSRSLRSLVDQDFDPRQYEIIIVSDGPDAATEKICRKAVLESPVIIRYFALPAKKGPAAARNLGWKKAAGELIAFTDDDCIATSGWLNNISKNYEGERMIAFSGKVTVPVGASPTDYEMNISHLETASFITANCACTKKALEHVQGFDERFKLAWREDSDLEFKLLQAGIPVVKLDEALIVHPVRKANWGVSIIEQKKSLYNALLYKKFPSLYRKKIQAKPLWHYYLIILSFLLFIIAAGLRNHVLGLLFFAAWLLLVGWFTAKRLKKTSHSILHVMEMFVTSMVIPFLSVYWTLYGARKFKVLFM